MSGAQVTFVQMQEPLLEPSSFSYWNSFQINLDEFLEQHGTSLTLPRGLKCWFITLRDGTRLHVYAEQIGEHNCICDQCRIIGWGIHPVSSVRYHFIVPAEGGPDSLQDPSSLPATAEAIHSGLHNSDTVGLPAQLATGASDGGHVSVYNAPPTIFDSSRHRLHGVLHSNGFGHLLRINGREGGSKSHTGAQLTTLWNSLCDGLRARRVTVEDVSSRSGMELRVLHTVAQGCTWYGQFGYNFGRGPYNATEHQWRAAAASISAASLQNLLHDFEAVEPGVPAIVQRYRLPVGKASKVRDLGTLFYRLLYLYANPEEGIQFFEPKALSQAMAVMQKEKVDAERRAAQRKGFGRHPKIATTGTGGGSGSVHKATTVKKKADASRVHQRGESTKGSKAASGKKKLKQLKSASVDVPVTDSKNKETAFFPLKGVIKRKSPEDDHGSGGGGGRQTQPATKRAKHDEHNHQSPSRTPQSIDAHVVEGRRVRVYLKEKRRWYIGIVEHWDSKSKRWSVTFRDFTKNLDLAAGHIQFLDSPAPTRDALKHKVAGLHPQTGGAAGAEKIEDDDGVASLVAEDKIKLYFPETRSCRVGYIDAVLRGGQQHRIRWLDGSKKEFNLRIMRWEVVEDEPDEHLADEEEEENEGLDMELKDTKRAQCKRRQTRSTAREEVAGTAIAIKSEEESEMKLMRRRLRLLRESPLPPKRGTVGRVLDALNLNVHGEEGATILRYKAKLAREDNSERARQLRRSLISLIPASKEVLGGAKSLGEMEEAFAKLIGAKDGPKITYKVWWESLPKLLTWAQDVLTPGGTSVVGRAKKRDARNAVKKDGNEIEIDITALHRLGMYPESWPVPLRLVSMRKANEAAAAGATSVAPPKTLKTLNPKPPVVHAQAAAQTKSEPSSPKKAADTGRHVTFLDSAAAAVKEEEEEDDEAPVDDSSGAGATTKFPESNRDRPPKVRLGCKACKMSKTGCPRCRSKAFDKLVDRGQTNLAQLVGVNACCGKKRIGCKVCWAKVMESLNNISSISPHNTPHKSVWGVGEDIGDHGDRFHGAGTETAAELRGDQTLNNTTKAAAGGNSKGPIKSKDGPFPETLYPESESGPVSPPRSEPVAAAKGKDTAKHKQQQTVTRPRPVPAPQMLKAGVDWPLPLTSTLPPVEFPGTLSPTANAATFNYSNAHSKTNSDTKIKMKLIEAAKKVVKLAAAHPGLWVAPDRLLGLTVATGLKDRVSAELALEHMGGHSFEGYAVHTCEHPNGGLYYYTEVQGCRPNVVSNPIPQGKDEPAMLLSAPLEEVQVRGPKADPPPEPRMTRAMQESKTVVSSSANKLLVKEPDDKKLGGNPADTAVPELNTRHGAAAAMVLDTMHATKATAAAAAAAPVTPADIPAATAGAGQKLVGTNLGRGEPLSTRLRSSKKTLAIMHEANTRTDGEGARNHPPQTKFKLHLPGGGGGGGFSKGSPPVGPAYRPHALQRPPAQQAAVDAAIAAALEYKSPQPQPSVSPGPVTYPLTLTSTPLPQSQAQTQAPAKPIWMDLVPGGDIPVPRTAAAARLQVAKDLHHLFLAVLKVYVPQVAKAAAEGAAVAMGERAATRVLKLRQLPGELQVLRDTKHFVKTCLGEMPKEGPQPPADLQVLRVWCTLSLPIEISSPPISTTRFGRKFLPVDPPAELVAVSATATIAEFMEAVTVIYRKVYRMCFPDFRATEVVSGLCGGAPPATSAADKTPPKKCGGFLPFSLWDPSTPIASLLPMDVIAKGDVPVVTVAGTGLDVSPEWLHAGGPEDWIVACPCGTRDDDGEAMVACDWCGLWMHTRCMGVPDDTPQWICPSCLKRANRIE